MKGFERSLRGTLIQWLVELPKHSHRAIQKWIETRLPGRSARAPPWSLPPLDRSADVPCAVSRIVEAVNEGAIVPREAVYFLQIVERFARIHHMADTAVRLACIEEHVAVLRRKLM
jgi:hypothetical protein